MSIRNAAATNPGLFLLLLCLPLQRILSEPAILGEALVWQIGEFDRSSAEFRQWIDPQSGDRLDYGDPSKDFHFQIGRSDPGRDWPAYQPGSANGGAGFRAHPCAIDFVLTNAPSGSYQLVLGLLAYSARLPILQVEVNGRQGWYYQQARLDHRGGDTGVFFLPYYSFVDLACRIPASFLRHGTNRMVLTAVDEPAERDDTRPAGFAWPGSSGIHYDALKFVQDRELHTSTPAVRVEATPFYQTQNGSLREQVDVIMDGAASGTPMTILLEAGKRQYSERFDTDRAFGEYRAQFLIDEFPDQTSMNVTVRAGEASWKFPCQLHPARKWTVFVVPNVHLDVGYTDSAAKVAEIQSRILDRALEWAMRPTGFRFTPDGFWCIEEFWNGRNPESRQRLLEALRAGTISLPAVYCSPFTGFASLENLIRLLYPSGLFAREYGLRCDVALNTDVPNYSWSFASVLAASGIRYFLGASDAYRAPFLLYNRYHESSPQRWEGPDGGSVTTWYSRHYHQLASLFGLPSQLASGRDTLPRFLQAYDRPAYRSDGVILYGSQAENMDLHPAQLEVVSQWNARYAYPRLKFASFAEALDHITAQAGTNLPAVRGDGGPYWEDGLGANALTTALARRNMRRILSAEKASSVASAVNPTIIIDKRAHEQAWRNILLTDEHTWHADCSVREPQSQQSQRQGAVKNARAADAQAQIDHLMDRGLAALADQVDAPPGSVLIFNPLSWARDGWVELDLERGSRLVNLESGETMPFEVLFSGNAIDHVRFNARDVPAVGYRCYAVKKGGAIETGDVTISNGILENRFYRLELDRVTGRVLSLRDKELGRELVSVTAAERFNEAIYVTGGDELPNRLVQYSTVSPMPHLELHLAQDSHLAFARRSAIGLTARVQSSAFNLPRVVTDYVMPDDQKRLEIVNRVTKTYTERKEAVYFAFPLAIRQPRFSYGTQNGVVDPARDLLPGASLEWFCLQDWLAAHDREFTVALALVDAPLITLGDIARGTWPHVFGDRPATVFSYVMNNYTPEGYQAGQGGDFLFRYRLTSAPVLDSVALHRFGAEASTPLEVDEITRNDKASADGGWLPPSKASFLELANDRIALVTWKLAESRKGSILRLLEVGGREGPVRVRFPFHRIAQAWLCNALEDDLRPLSANADGLTLDLGPYSITTLRIELALTH